MTAVVTGSDLELDRDRGLVERHQAGDDAAFTQLYALHYGRLVHFCHRLTRDHHLAEELAQEAFARAFASLDRLAGERRFYPWLTVIARRLVIDQVRLNGRVESRPFVELGFSVPAEDEVVRRIDGAYLSSALDRLTDRHREILRLRDWEGMSYDAIAERLGVAVTTVPPLLHRARATLRREYLRASRLRTASWLAFPALALRRLRDRAMARASAVPDPTIFAAPLAGAVLGLSTLIGSGFLGGAEATTTTFGTGPGGGSLGVPLAARAAWDRAATHATDGAATPPGGAPIVDSGAVMGEITKPIPRQDYVVPGVVGWYRSPEGSRRAREYARQMPIYHEFDELGGFMIAVDPDAPRKGIERIMSR